MGADPSPNSAKAFAKTSLLDESGLGDRGDGGLLGFGVVGAGVVVLGMRLPSEELVIF